MRMSLDLKTTGWKYQIWSRYCWHRRSERPLFLNSNLMARNPRAEMGSLRIDQSLEYQSCCARPPHDWGPHRQLTESPFPATSPQEIFVAVSSCHRDFFPGFFETFLSTDQASSMA